MSNAAERIREFLSARAAAGYTESRVAYIPAVHNPEGQTVELREADLEAVLQTLEILSHVAKVQAEHNPPLVISRASLAEVWEAGARSLPGEPNPYREEP